MDFDFMYIDSCSAASSSDCLYPVSQIRRSMPHEACSAAGCMVKNCSGEPNMPSRRDAVEKLMPFILEKAMRATGGSMIRFERSGYTFYK